MVEQITTETAFDPALPPMQPVQSSNIDSIGHNNESLFVKFKNGNMFHYAGVLLKDFEALIGAESIGKHFAANIKDKFPANVVTPSGETISLTKEGNIDEPNPETETSGSDGTIGTGIDPSPESSVGTDAENPDAPASEIAGTEVSDDASVETGKDETNAGYEQGKSSTEITSAADDTAGAAQAVFVKQGEDPPKPEDPQSDNLDQLRAALANYDIDFQYEHAVDKNGVEHWNLKATLGDENDSRQITKRIDGDATEEDVSIVHDEIVKEFMSGVKS